VSKNVAVFVDVANIFYAAKAAGADIDYVTLLKAAVGSRDFVRAYAYTGLDPENENQRNFHAFLARHGYKVVSKDIRKYGDGKVKANLDIELVVDMMKTARNLDVAILVSGDGDFAPAIRAVQEMGVRVEVISFRGNTSSDLIDVADAFYDITQVAKVDRDSSASGRRVASDDEDLSMTEVPDKQTEGRGGRRGRSRRTGSREAEVTTSGRKSTRGPIVALPGEKLSRAAVAAAASSAAASSAAAEEADEESPADLEAAGEEGGQAGHRRRRRGGRGRGRRGHGAIETMGEEPEEEGEVGTLPAPKANQFGSVWDSQIGMDARPERLSAELPADEEDYAEPEIPEYLLAERRRSGGGGGGGRGGRGGRGARSAYASAVERERFGRSSSHYSVPARQPQRRRDERPARPPQPQPQRQRNDIPRSQPRGSDEPWSEVPAELEELLRAQLAARKSRPAEAAPAPAAEAQAEAAAPKRRTTRKKAETVEGGDGVAAEAPAKPARSRRKTAAGDDGAEAEAAAPKRRTTRKKAAEAETAETAEPVGE
jgi:uncharacterized LabA/DUF88 family protein